MLGRAFVCTDVHPGADRRCPIDPSTLRAAATGRPPSRDRIMPDQIPRPIALKTLHQADVFPGPSSLEGGPALLELEPG
jgi:hypothetical protein